MWSSGTDVSVQFCTCFCSVAVPLAIGISWCCRDEIHSYELMRMDIIYDPGLKRAKFWKKRELYLFSCSSLSFHKIVYFGFEICDI